MGHSRTHRRSHDASPRAAYRSAEAHWERITVCTQPGNNYRAAASCIDDVFGGSDPQVDQTDADAKQYDHSPGWSGYQVPAVWSKMLTVWRKLTLEVDSMGAESQAYNVRFESGFEHDRCEVGSIAVDSPAPGFTTVYCTENDGHTAGFAGFDFFEGGALVRRDTGQEFLIVRSHLGEVSNVVIVWGAPGPDIVGVVCTLRDDDPYFPTGPRQLPKTTVLDNNIVTAYRNAYIETVEAAPILNSGSIVDWNSNLSNEGLLYDYTFQEGVSDQWNIGSSDSFWVRHLVVCYQPGADVDSDGDIHENCGISQNCLAPFVPYPLLGLSTLPSMDQVFGRTIRNETWYNTALSVVYIEATRDDSTDATSAKFWQYVAHEIGHITVLLGGDESSGEHIELGLMTGVPEAPALQDIPGHRRFTATTLRRFRKIQRW